MDVWRKAWKLTGNFISFAGQKMRLFSNIVTYGHVAIWFSFVVELVYAGVGATREEKL